MGALVGLGFGIGALLIWSAFFLPRQPKGRDPRGGRAEQLLARSGLGDVSPTEPDGAVRPARRGCVRRVQAVTRAAPVALCFALMAGYLPLGVLKSRARRRQAEFAEVWPDAVDNLASGVRAGLSLPEAVSRWRPTAPSRCEPTSTSSRSTTR